MTRAVLLLAPLLAAALAHAGEGVLCTPWQRVVFERGLDADELRAVAYGGGRFVAVGDRENLVSNDGTTWTVGWDSRMNDVVWFADRFWVSSRYRWNASWSEDGLHWNAIEGVGSYASVAASPGMIVMAGGKEFASSCDGEEWSIVEAPIAHDESLIDLCWSGSSWLGLSSDGALVTSSDGHAWGVGTPLVPGAESLAAGNGRFVAVGYRSYTSTDAATWLEILEEAPELLHGVAWTDPGWVVVGEDGLVMRSLDGIDWSIARHATGSLRDVTRAQDLTVAVGDRTLTVSEDEAVWHDLVPGWPRAAGMVWDGRRFVVAALQEIYLTPDGVTWDRVEVVPEHPSTVPWMTDVAYDGRTYVMVGSNSGLLWSSPRILLSPDGFEWDDYGGAGCSNGHNGLWAVARGDPGFVTTSFYGGVGFSPDGRCWDFDSSIEWPMDVVWDGLRFVALGWGMTYISVPIVDGIAWIPAGAVDIAFPAALASNGSGYVATGTGGVAVSADALTWFSAESPGDSYLVDVVWDGHEWIAADAEAGLWSSADGLSWQPEPAGWVPEPYTGEDLALAQGGNRTLLVGDGFSVFRDCWSPGPEPRRPGGRLPSP